MGRAVLHAAMVGLLGQAFVLLCLALAVYWGGLLHSISLGFVLVAGLLVIVLGAFQLWWKLGARDRFVLRRINDLNDGA